jgi:hypothetical protein
MDNKIHPGFIVGAFSENSFSLLPPQSQRSWRACKKLSFSQRSSGATKDSNFPLEDGYLSLYFVAGCFFGGPLKLPRRKRI